MAVALSSSMPHSSPHEWLNETLVDLKSWIEAHEEAVKKRKDLQREKGSKPKPPRRRGRR
ncbi:hypothetical protein EDM58_21990 [Brevibacillus panacihumi]|uniref:Uncharacterized protein n=1 Tax=Brevibacillus panacihumi TaxID=497735 RepID=A0A3M8C9X2_9BACL|nr:hypothetical protein EDM58_21990 [Brevibacillus panacihumi]